MSIRIPSARRRFAKLYAKRGRPSIAPEKLLRALLLQVLYPIPSERQLMEQLDYNLLFRWFVGLNMDDAMWDVAMFTKNRERLLKGQIAQAFFEKVLEQARAQEPALRGALRGGWNVDRGVGGAEEFSAQRYATLATGRWRQRIQAELSGTERAAVLPLTINTLSSRNCVLLSIDRKREGEEPSAHSTSNWNTG